MQDSGSPPVSASEIPTTATAPALDPRANRSALLIVFLVMFIDLLGFGIVLPLLPRYGREILDPLYPGYENRHVQSMILGLLMSSFSLMQFIFAPIWGRLSDREGRRPFLLLGLTGSVLFYALFGFASDLGPGRELLSLGLLFVARIGAGIAGATVSTAQAVIADCTPPERRSHGMALIGAAFGIGFTFGPLLGAGPCYVACGFSFIALILAVRLMPETLRTGVAAGHRGWFNLSGLRLALQTPTVGTLILAFFLSTLAFACFEPTLALLTQDLLGYSDRANFLVFAYVGLVLTLAQGILYRRLAKRGVGEIPLMLIGAALMAVGLGAVGAAAALKADYPPTASVLVAFLAAITVAVVGFSFVTPSASALISRRSDPAKQGEILGVNQSANAVSRI
ncbi:MAG: MFS transporter, partial [Planctomycetota bacterium]